MSGEVLINLTPMETRVAVVENGVLQEAFIERSGRRGIVGNIYRGKVNSRLVPAIWQHQLQCPHVTLQGADGHIGGFVRSSCL